MKLRQKLAVVLASAMVVTAVPVITMAASTNALLKETIKIQEDGSFYRIATANAVKMTFKDHQSGDEVFYLDLTDAKWDADLFNNADHADGELGFVPVAGKTNAWELKLENATDPIAIYEMQGKTSMKVTVPDAIAGGDEGVVLPILATMTGADAKVAVVTKGGQTTASNGEWVFATSSDKNATYKVGDLPAFYLSGEIADLVLTETYTGSLADGAKVTLEVADGEFNFVGYDNIEVEGSYGFGDLTFENGTDFTVEEGNDKGSIVITFKALSDADKAAQDSMGTLTVSGIKVKANTKDPETGDLLIDVKSDNLVDAKNDVVFAKVAEYGTYIEMEDEKAVEMYAGNIEDVKFTIGEVVEDSMVGGREFEIKIDKAHFDWKTIVKEYGTLKDGDDKVITDDKDKDKADKKKSDGNLNVEKMYADDVITDATFKIGDEKSDLIKEMYFDTKDNGEIIPDTLIVVLDKNTQINKNIDKMTFELPVCVPIDKKDDEKAVITASGRALENEVSVDAVTIKNPVNISSDVATVKVGLAKQKTTGKVVLSETDKEMFKKGGDIVLKVKDIDGSSIKITGATFTVDGDIKKVDNSKDKDSMKFTINRTSKGAATLTVSDIEFTVDRTVPEGKYDLQISGSGIDADGHSITIKDFVVVGTPNTEDLAANGLRRGTTTFVIGEASYTANGIAYPMTAAAYIQDPGYTMIPVRYVAEAFGVAQKDILFSAGTATFFAGERTVQLTNGSDVAIVNGAPIKLATKVVIKDNRTYAPVGEVAKILGIKGTWDNTNKIATFINE